MKSFLSGILLLPLVSAAFAQEWQCPITQDTVNRAMITSDYGPRNVRRGSWFHLGIDLGYPNGTQVYTVEAGRLDTFTDRSINELVLRVTHDIPPSPSLYLHLSSFAYPLIRRVNKGELIGYVGQGHLHFQFGWISL